MSGPDYDGWDPLGRLADHVARPYPAPVPTEGTLRRHWREHYGLEAAGLSEDQLRDELTDARRHLDGLKRDGLRIEGAAFGQATARRVRLQGKVDAFAAALGEGG